MSTPEVDSLRTIWRSSHEHLQAQVYRVGRIFGGALATQVSAQFVATGFETVNHLDQKLVVSLLVAALEATWRQLHPALTASQVETTPGVIVSSSPAAVTESPLMDDTYSKIDAADIPSGDDTDSTTVTDPGAPA